MIYHGYARYTGDVDLFYDIEIENCRKLFAALAEFWGGPVPAVDSEDTLQVLGQVIQFGVPPFRIDLLNRIDGIEFAEAYTTAIQESITHQRLEIPIRIISKDVLKKNKIASARAKDLDDLQMLK